MDIKRAKELIKELSNLADQIDEEEISVINKITEKLEIEIKTKIMAILNELDIRPLEIGLRDEI
ncbi:MAG: hypothetical protein ACFE94_06585 [Candidatus Hodarchaeota archaeon]